MPSDLSKLLRSLFNEYPEATDKDLERLCNEIYRDTKYRFTVHEIRPHYNAHYKLKEQIRKKRRAYRKAQAEITA